MKKSHGQLSQAFLDHGMRVREPGTGLEGEKQFKRYKFWYQRRKLLISLGES